MVSKGASGTGASILSNGELSPVNTTGTIVAPNGAVSSANTGYTIFGEFSALVIVESFGTSIWAGEGVAVLWKVGRINSVTRS